MSINRVVEEMKKYIIVDLDINFINREEEASSILKTC